jgi:excisionase family DNA binding protein
MTTERWCTVQEAAELRGCSPRWIRRLIADGTIPATQVRRDGQGAKAPWLVLDTTAAAPRPDLEGLPPEWQERALLVEAAEAFAASRPEMGKLEAMNLWSQSAEGRPSRPTVMRYKLKLESWRTRGVEPTAQGRPAEGVEVPPRVAERFRTLWLTPERPSVSACYRITKTEAKAMGWEMPSLRTMQRFAQAIPADERAYHRQGRRRWEASEAPYQDRSVEHMTPHQMWNADHCQLDVLVETPDGSIVCPWMCAIQDLRTRAIIGWRMVPGSANQWTVLSTLAETIAEHGRPQTLLVDNGRDFVSKVVAGGLMRFRALPKEIVNEVRGALSLLHIELKNSKPYSGRSKPIERSFQTLQGDMLQLLPGYRGATVDRKPEGLADRRKRGEVLSWEQMLTVMEAGISRYNALPHRTLGGQSPAEMLGAWASTGGRRMVPAAMLAAATMDHRRRKVRRGEVVIDHRTYYSRELLPHNHRDVIVRFDPEKPDAVWVYDAKDRYLALAPAKVAVAFDDADAAAAIAQEREARRKEIVAQAPEKLSLDERVRLAILGAPEERQLATGRVVELAPLGFDGDTQRRLRSDMEAEAKEKGRAEPVRRTAAVVEAAELDRARQRDKEAKAAAFWARRKATLMDEAQGEAKRAGLTS